MRQAKPRPGQERVFAAGRPAGGPAPDPSAALDGAFDEFCRLREAGQEPDAEEFCRRFPSVASGLRRLIEVESFLEHDHELLLAECAPEWPACGTTFLGFELVRELGRGGLARVYLARESALGGRPVALKLAPCGAGEARVLGRLSHPNVVPVYSVRRDSVAGLTAICMPFLGAATLQHVLRRLYTGPERPRRARAFLDELERLNRDHGEAPEPPLRRGSFESGVRYLACELAEGLAAVHAHGVCHGDLKPSNVLLGPGGRPMLLDFNLSSDPRGGSGPRGGTPDYMAPEQIQSVFPLLGPARTEVGPRSDLFSLGVIVYECLTGVHPFAGAAMPADVAGQAALVLERQQAGPRPVRSLNRRVGRRLARVVEGCLAFDARRRPASAVQLGRDLRNAVSPLRRWVRLAAGHPIRTLVTAVGIGLGSAGVWLAVTPSRVARAMEAGAEAYQGGRFEEAGGWFARATEADPSSGPAWLARGGALSKLGRYSEAADAYARAAERMPDGRADAGLGYCQSRMRLHAQGIASYRRAMDRGWCSAEVLNDLACSLLQDNIGMPAEAERLLEEAIRREPTLGAAYHNRAWADFARWMLRDSHLPAQGARDMEEAVRLGPQTPELYLDAAFLCAAAGDRRRAIAHLKDAARVAGGVPRDLALKQPFQSLAEEPEFHRLCGLPVSPAFALPTPRLVDPLGDVAR